MADCSAVGTTIDRAARAVLGDGASTGHSAAVASKHVGALLGHASMVGAPYQAGSAIGMPMSIPNYLVMPTSVTHSEMNVEGSIAHHRSVGDQLRNASNDVSNVPAMTFHPPSQVQPHPHFQHSNPRLMMDFENQQRHHFHVLQQQQAIQVQPHLHFHQQQQQHMAMTMMMHEQQRMQQMQIQHYQQLQQLQQEHHDNLKVPSRTRTTISTQKLEQPVQDNVINAATTGPSLDDWHQGLEDDLAAEIAALGGGSVGHEGIVSGASLEQLAAAWAEAEAEYDDTGVAATLGESGEHGTARGAGIEELAAAWARAEAELDQEYSEDHWQGTAAESYEDFGNLWQGDIPLEESLASKPYEFVNVVANDVIQDGNAQSPTFDFMGDGMKHFRDGNIREAIRSFEMELQLQNSDNATAWRMLGRCHAENDQDPQAIQCLEAAVDRDPFSPESLLALGVSYVNELSHERALENMKAWFTHNPRYAGLELPQTNNIGLHQGTANRNESAFDEVKSMLLAALEHDPTDAGDVHEALGVIYNVIKDYDAAAESFRRAIQSRPDDYQLWNKLGATLANGSQSDRALPAYHSAIQIKPKYTRAWLNMAISHSNLQDHHEAARCYLQTLSLNPGAKHCWTYLRMALSSMERWDLLPLVFSQDLPAFQEHFDFVLY